MDISTKDQTAVDIFKYILDAGPVTLYATSTNTRFPLGTIHRHFKELEKASKIKIYYQNPKGRRKKMYGPTFYGIVYFARLDSKMLEKIENYFLLWIENKEFLDILKNEGFDIIKLQKNPKDCKQLFRKYVEYGIIVENQIDILKNDSKSISHDMLIFIGEILLTSNPKFTNHWRYLYKNLPGLQKAIDTNIQNLIAMQKQLKE